MVLLELFISFLKIGFTSFGGVSMVPLINSEMLSHGWMNAQEVIGYRGNRGDDAGTARYEQFYFCRYPGGRNSRSNNCDAWYPVSDTDHRICGGGFFSKIPEKAAS